MKRSPTIQERGMEYQEALLDRLFDWLDDPSFSASSWPFSRNEILCLTLFAYAEALRVILAIIRKSYEGDPTVIIDLGVERVLKPIEGESD